MADRYKDLIPKPIVYMLKETIGHWPQVEDTKSVLDAFMSFHKENVNKI